MIKELENKIGQLQYEISLLGLDQEDLTGVTTRTDELKDLVKNLSLSGVSQQRELLVAAFEKMNRPQITMLEIGEYEELAKELLSSD